jgi:hypothetical protein
MKGILYKSQWAWVICGLAMTMQARMGRQWASYWWPWVINAGNEPWAQPPISAGYHFTFVYHGEER